MEGLLNGPQPINELAESSSKRIKKEERERNAGEEKTEGKEIIDQRRWEDLPINCLVGVFEKLGLDDMTLGVPFVCKYWYGASLDPTCWKVLDFRTINPWQGSPFSERFKHDYHVDNFTFRGFLKFVINRSHRLVTKLILPRGHVPLTDLIYVCDECPMVKIFSSLYSGREADSPIRKLICKLKEIIMQRDL